MENTPDDKPNATFQKESVLFATIRSTGIGVLACLASGLVAEGIHSSWLAKKPKLPSLQRVCDFIASSKNSELRVSWVLLGITAISGGYGFAKAMKHKRQIERNASSER